MKQNSETDNRIRSKLRSESGASISFALLLFLVCTALSAVILVAATTAAGRMAGIAETDQRYYSVTSAAELISDIADGETVSAVKLVGSDGYLYFSKPLASVTMEDINKASSNASAASEPAVDTDAEGTVEDVKSSPVGKGLTLADTDFVGALAAYIFGISESNPDWILRSTDTTTALISDDPLAVDISGSLDSSDDAVILEVCNADGGPFNGDDEEPYTLCLELSFEKSEYPDVIPAVSEEYLPGGDQQKIADAKEVRITLSGIYTPYDESVRNSLTGTTSGSTGE